MFKTVPTDVLLLVGGFLLRIIISDIVRSVIRGAWRGLKKMLIKTEHDLAVYLHYRNQAVARGLKRKR